MSHMMIEHMPPKQLRTKQLYITVTVFRENVKTFYPRLWYSEDDVCDCIFNWKTMRRALW